MKAAVAALPPAALAEFQQWVVAFDAEKWDRQIAQNVASGKLDNLAVEALLDYRLGLSNRQNQ